MARNIRPTRRRFIQSAGAVAAATWATGPAILRAQSGDKLRIAMIGVGGRGRANLKGVASEHIAAVCDVDRTALDQAAALYPQARKEVDFRRIFDHPGEFDAVLVSTTEHTHAFATLPALQLKKHVYCEKPLAYNVQQTRIIREAAAKAGVVTQMGTQVHASDNYRRVVEIVQSGAPRQDQRVPRLGGRARGAGTPPRPSPRSSRTSCSCRTAPRPWTPFPPASTGTCGSARRLRGRTATSTCPGPSGIAGGISATGR